MSVKAHEAYCIDSAQDRLLFYDDFLGDSIRDLWALTVTGTGAGAVVDAQDGGVYRLRCPAANDTAQLSWGGIKTLSVLKNVTMEVKAKLNSTDDVTVTLNLYKDTHDRIRFTASVGDIYSEKADDTYNEAGWVTDTDWHIYRIECHYVDATNATANMYIDGVECTNSPIPQANVPIVSLEPFFSIGSGAGALAEKQLDIDYVYVRQDR